MIERQKRIPMSGMFDFIAKPIANKFLGSLGLAPTATNIDRSSTQTGALIVKAPINIDVRSTQASANEIKEAVSSGMREVVQSAVDMTPGGVR